MFFASYLFFTVVSLFSWFLKIFVGWTFRSDYLFVSQSPVFFFILFCCCCLFIFWHALFYFRLNCSSSLVFRQIFVRTEVYFLLVSAVRISLHSLTVTEQQLFVLLPSFQKFFSEYWFYIVCMTTLQAAFHTELDSVVLMKSTA